MTQIIDHRVVEMRFDNRQFEAGTKKTIGTLEKLKDALKLPNSEKALEGVSKAAKDIKLDGIAAGVEALERRFSTFGIVGMRVIENITDGLMGKLNSAVNFVTDSIVSGGIKRAMNIENAHFQLQALLKDETKVQAVMANAMESVDGTAYAYDEAAKAASQFAASGIQAGEEMLNALKGITGVAAMTNSGFEDISRIFTTVAGNGRLMGDQLLQLSSRGLNAASTLSDYFREVRGQSQMTEATIRDMVSKGQISFKDFSDAMTWAFGDSAKRANETFTGAFSNMKSALARIGAGFISPLVEQNGELVSLFNALRIQINNVKSALVFDEETSAISGLTKQAELLTETVSGFVTDGKIGFDALTTAILGTSKSEEELNKTNEKLSGIFDQVKEGGFVTIEMLNEFASNGVLAASSIQDFLNGVTKGTIKTSKVVKQSIEEITEGLILGPLDVLKLAEDGKISYEVFTASIVNSSGVIKDSTSVIGDSIKGLFKEVKDNGSVSVDMLNKFADNGIMAATSITEYINSVLDGTTRATYATKQAIEEITEGSKIGGMDIIRLAEEGKISYDIFQSAIERTYGDQNKKMSKQFTDFVLDEIKALVNVIQNADLTKPMEGFYYGLESVKNVLKALLSIAKPLGIAFADVFLNFSGDDFVDFAASIEELTSKMKLSEEESENLHDAFEGIFNVAKLLIDIFFALVGAVMPINEPIIEAGDGLLGLAGATGKCLTEFTKIIRSSTLLRKVFGGISTSFFIATKGITKIIKTFNKIGSSIYGLEGTQKLLNSISAAFIKLSRKATPGIESFVKGVNRLTIALLDIDNININIDDILKMISDVFSELSWVIDNFSFKTLEQTFENLGAKLKAFSDLIMSNESFATFVKNARQFGLDLEEAFTMDNLLDRMEKIMEVFGKFFGWVKTVLSPAFESFDLGNTVAAAGGVSIIYVMIKAIKSFEKIAKVAESVPNLLGAVKGTLVAYQKDLKASALIKVAGAIFILAGAITLLSFADMEQAWQAAIMLGLVGSALVLAVSKFVDVVKMTRTVNDASYMLAKAGNNLAKALKWRAVGSAIKSFATSVALIAGSIIALGLMYNENPDAFNTALKTVGAITAVLVVIMGLMAIAAKFGDARGMGSVGRSILAVSMSLALVVMSLSKLMKMDLPDDYKTKMDILAEIVLGMVALVLVLGAAANIAGGNALPKISSTIKSLAILLFATVLSLKMLFDMTLPDDAGLKIGILAGIFATLGLLMIAIAGAAKLAGGNAFKAGGTILAMAGFLAVVVGALFVLTLIPGDKMLRGALALGGILIALGAALYGAGKITKKDTYKTVLAMAAAVGAIVVALAVLSLIDTDDLMFSAIALGGVLFTLAKTFQSLSKVKSKKVLPAIVAMVAVIAEIAGALYLLSNQPWPNLLAAAGALSATLLAFSKSFEMVMGKNWSKNNVKKVGTFLLLTLAVIPIGVALAVLANQPWDGMLASGLSLSATVLAFSKSFEMILSRNWSGNNVKKIGTFLLLTLAVIPIGLALAVLANQPWEGLLAGAAGLSLTVIALAGCFAILSKVKVDLKAVGAVVAGAIALLAVAAGIGLLAKYDGNSLLNACLALDSTLLVMVGVMAVCALLSNVAGQAIAGVIALGVVIAELALVLAAIGGLAQIPGLTWLIDEGGELLEGIGVAIGKFIGGIAGGFLSGVTSQLPQVGLDLSAFMANLTPFILGMKLLDASSLANVGFLSAIILGLTGAEIINGIASLFGLSLVDVAVELSEFMVALTPFIMSCKMIDKESMEACKYLSDMILSLTGAQLLAGIGEFFGLSGKLSDFADELKAFGPSIAQFADDVKDVKPEAVEGAAAAAEIMADVASKLQGHGGFIQELIGDKSLKTFADELKAFGPSIAQFADDVKDVKPEAVEGAAAAAEIMAELADKLPNSGGLLAWITGDNTLSDFGAELEAFGPLIKKFANDVKDVNPSAVLGVSNILAIMSTLANNLPNSGGLVSWFTGDNTLSDFGSQMVEFGDAFKEFYNIIKDINTADLSLVISEFSKLIELAKKFDGTDSSGLSDFAKALKNMATSGLKEFIKAFTGATPKAKKVVDDFTGAIIDEFKAKLLDSTFNQIGSSMVILFISGINSESTNAISTVASLCNSIRAEFNSKLSANEFKEIGSYAMQGLISGMKSEMNDVETTSATISKSIVSASKAALDEHSPSKELFEVGGNATLGLIKGLAFYAAQVINESKRISESIIMPMNAAIGRLPSEIDFMVNNDPTIRPTVDLSNVTAAVKDVQNMFNMAISMEANIAYSTSSTFRRKRDSDELIDAIRDLELSRKEEKTGDTYIIDGIRYKEGDEVSNAIESLVRVAKIKRRV